MLVWIFAFTLAFAEPPAVDPAALEKLLQQQRDDVAECTRNLDASPNSIQSLSARGDAYLFLGEFGKARADYERMIAIEPAQDAPHWRLGIAYHFTGQWEKSSKQFAKYHAYDGRDRENGVWKFFADAHSRGLDAARREMLPYTEFDREPFPKIYDLLAGKITRAEFDTHVNAKGIADDKVASFYALYYGGLNDELLGKHEEALKQLRSAVALFSPPEAGRNGPGFMWQCARLHLDVLTKAPSPTNHNF